MDNTGSREMPRYVCHKEVWALKIESILPCITGYLITPQESGYASFIVNVAYYTKHEPKPGGYYVMYADGYESFSPAEAFETGYTKK